MRNNQIIRFLCILLLLAFAAGAIPASAADDSARIDAALEGIVHDTFGATEAEGISKWLAENVGITAEWYVLAFARWGTHEDFEGYAEALMTYLSENTVASATTRQKFAIALLASGHDADYVRETANESAGALGVMSRIFALHLASLGYAPEGTTADDAVEALLALRLADGGFAVSSEFSDTDVTAMALQALAPYGKREDVSVAIEEGLALLRTMQKESGGFASHGVENAESTAQVILALSTFGVENFAEAGFVKNGNTPLDALLSYRCEDGGFSHEKEGKKNAMATAQAYLALSSVKYGGSLYEIDMSAPRTFLEMPEVQEMVDEPADKEAPASWKWTAFTVILSLALVLCAVLFFLKKRNYKNYLLIFVLAGVLSALLFLLDIQTPEDYYGGTTSKENAVGTVTLEIRCDTLIGREESHISADGVILERTEFAIEEGETVFDILTEAAKTYKIQMEYEGSGTMIYVAGIDYLYELAYGELSGWVYHVNGESPSVGCGAYVLSDGDEIVWYYTLNLGKDIS